MRTDGFTVVDLFSGAGGMSFGFHKHADFRIVAAADAELGKPSTGRGKLQCNGTYVKNIGVRPAQLDLSSVRPSGCDRSLGSLTLNLFPSFALVLRARASAAPTPTITCGTTGATAWSADRLSLRWHWTSI